MDDADCWKDDDDDASVSFTIKTTELTFPDSDDDDAREGITKAVVIIVVVWIPKNSDTIIPMKTNVVGEDSSRRRDSKHPRRRWLILHGFRSASFSFPLIVVLSEKSVARIWKQVPVLTGG